MARKGSFWMSVTRVMVLGGCHVAAGILGLVAHQGVQSRVSAGDGKVEKLTYGFVAPAVRLVDATDWLDACATRVMGSASSGGNALRKRIVPGRMMRWKGGKRISTCTSKEDVSDSSFEVLAGIQI